MSTPEAEEARRQCEAYHQAWLKEERIKLMATLQTFGPD